MTRRAPRPESTRLVVVSERPWPPLVGVPLLADDPTPAQRAELWDRISRELGLSETCAPSPLVPESTR